jgi:hypothetical protein
VKLSGGVAHVDAVLAGEAVAARLAEVAELRSDRDRT